VSEDDTAMLAMWDAKMSTASIALMLGRKEHAVDRRVHQLVEQRRASVAPPQPPEPPPIPAEPPAPPPLPAIPPAPPPLPVPPPTYALVVGRGEGKTSLAGEITRLVGGPAGEGMRPSPPPGAWRKWIAPPAGSAGKRAPNPITERKQRYMGWFLKAGWRQSEVAQLFDVELQDLREAFDIA
jgi:hypothetical protein